jgi:hypothetical protein
MNARSVVCAAGLLLTLMPSLASTQTLRRRVIACGGGTSVSASHRVQGTIGQATAGRAIAPNTIVYVGYWRTAAFSGGAGLEPAVVPAVDLPPVVAFTRAWPNPAAGAMRFGVDLPADSDVDLELLDVQGRRVRVVERRRREAGSHALSWDARDDRGARVRPGVYFARLVVDGRRIGDRRVVLTE